MKKVIVLLSAALLLFTSCNQGEEIRAEFIYLDDAAVLKGKDFIYGVEINRMSKKLAERVEPVKVEEFDMVPVVIKGIIKDKPENEEGWDKIVVIKKIVSIDDRPSKPDVKIE
jgi:hypothetical protein